MLYNSHYIELYINGTQAEVTAQKSLGLRMNNVLSTPNIIDGKQAEYSFSFSLPSTKVNDKIFGYANNLSKKNKFTPRYSAEVYADGQLIFQGTLLLKGVKDKMYECNLLKIKKFSLDDIFGDMTLNKVSWEVPFSGVTTINELNSEGGDVMFPLISYGVFKKVPYFSDEVANDYTSKFLIDEYNKWYVDSFYPSLNYLSLIKHLFDTKGYVCTGDAFADPLLQDIYLSTNLASEQVPIYNLGNERFGKVDISGTFSNSGTGYEQELQYPYFYVYNKRGNFGTLEQIAARTLEAFNWDTISVFDLMSGTTGLHNEPCYMFDPDEKCIVIPADGFYKISLTVDGTLNTRTKMTVGQYAFDNDDMGSDLEFKDFEVTPTFDEFAPLEIQLVRNYQDNIELIKGKNNKQYYVGDPTKQVCFPTGIYSPRDNISEWQTCFPHEDAFQSSIPTKKNNLQVKYNNSMQGEYDYAGFGERRNEITPTYENRTSFGASKPVTERTSYGASVVANNTNAQTDRNYKPRKYGYVHKDGEVMGYDRCVSEAFICGFSTLLGGTISVMKDGRSWSPTVTVENQSFYNNSGYNMLERQADNDYLVETSTSKNKNTFKDAPADTLDVYDYGMHGSLSCTVYLNRNDILELFAVQRYYENKAGRPVTYAVSGSYRLTIEAVSPNNKAHLESVSYGYNSPTEFPYNLQIGEFLNNETLAKDFIENSVKAFNLEITQDGNTISINRKKQSNSEPINAVDIDDRVNANNAYPSRIDFPTEMYVSYKINTDEWGFERTVPNVYLNTEGWEQYGDSGFTKIVLDDTQYEKNVSSVNTPFSYCWYDTFTDSNDNKLKIPVISNYSWMIDGYNYDESMKHDGFSLTQRCWFKPKRYGTLQYSITNGEKVDIYTTSNVWDKQPINLSYKTTESSLLQRYFNIFKDTSESYVSVDCYLTAEEYTELKNGAMVRLDKSLYKVGEISGYDPSGTNKTTLKLIG